MEPIKRNDTGAAVEDVQARLARIGHLPEDAITGTFDDATVEALAAFLAESALPVSEEVTEKVWSALVDASYNLGDRTLYLRMPYFHGHDVFELQQALGALGFFYGARDAIFGAHTEEALRRFQLNLGLPSDGIAGAYTYAALRNLAHSWVGKEATHGSVRHLGFARAADVLERNAVCLFGTDEFSRSVASRMSNLSQATNPASKIISADSLSVPPDASMMLVHVLLDAKDADAGVPLVSYEEEDTLSLRLASAVDVARDAVWPRLSVLLPGTVWLEAGPERSAQHYAITLLDALCSALQE
ncbi:peptidoglycan-binding protein [Adlercreutzia sp. R25]|uniref:Peptidoglycan-binding protein n=1 Tax=Adlercreutzia shanghongiae TaxID=3111773 RepID=A0ABU6IZP0_9ACTN|nr:MULTISPECIES: peptidoglycan-binding protein [unclassified Adlercreutzia]MEC4273162.1 peptidoglycan-binding protein [Adlercreutzia sp. R25]MEC4295354.1 peptidoglycan-binding protein [Adlercreutzia sp. R22]